MSIYISCYFGAAVTISVIIIKIIVNNTNQPTVHPGIIHPRAYTMPLGIFVSLQVLLRCDVIINIIMTSKKVKTIYNIIYILLKS